MEIIVHRSRARAFALYYCGVAGICVVIVSLLWTNHRVLTMPVFAFVFLAATMLLSAAVPYVRTWGVGYFGERIVHRSLNRLPDAYRAVTNFVVPGTKQGDVDLLLLGPMGIVVVEIKTYEGHILYEDGRWWKVQDNGWKTRIKNVSSQVKSNARAVSKYIAGEQRSGQKIPIHPAVVILRAYRVEADNLDLPILRRAELADYVLGLPACLGEAEVEKLVNLFRPTTPEGDDARKISAS